MTTTRTDRAQRVLYLEALAKAAAEAARTERDFLAGEAAAEHANGCTPSWRLRDLGLVTGRVSADQVDVVDERALTAWVEARHPEHIESRVRPAFVEYLRRTAHPADGGKVVDGEGDDGEREVIPGLRFTPGGRFLGVAFRPDPVAREVFELAAAQGLSAAVAAPGSPFAAEVAQAAEAVAMLAAETPGHLDPQEV